MNTIIRERDNRDSEEMDGYLEARVEALERRVQELEALTDGGYREQGK